MTFVFGNNGEVTIYGEEETDLISVEDIESVEIFPLEKITINDIDPEVILSLTKSDKKMSQGKIKFILLKKVTCIFIQKMILIVL